MNKSDLVQQVASQLNLTKSDAGKAVEAVIRPIRGVGRVCELRAFGKSSERNQAGAVASQPVTRNEITPARKKIAARNIVCGRSLDVTLPAVSGFNLRFEN